MLASSAAAMAAKSSASATGCPWKLPPEIISSRLGEDERIVGRRRGLALEHAARVRERVAAGAVHLRHAAQRIGVLHFAAVLVRLDDARVGEQPRASCAPTPPARGAAARPGCARSNARGVPLSASSDSAPMMSASRAASSASRSASAPIAVMHCVPLTSVMPSLASNASGCRPALAQRLAAVELLAVDERFAFAHDDQRQVRQRRQVARGADRVLRAGMTGWTPRLSISSSSSRDLGAHARVAERRAPARAGASCRAPPARGSGAPTPAACERMRLRCRLRMSSAEMRTSAREAEAGVDAVDRRRRVAALLNAVDHEPRGIDAGARIGAESYLVTAARHAGNRFEGRTARRRAYACALW